MSEPNFYPCCPVHDEDPCPQSDTGHILACNGDGAPFSCHADGDDEPGWLDDPNRTPASPPVPTVAQIEHVLVYHCRIGAHTCRECGDMPLGSSFARHQAELIAALR